MQSTYNGAEHQAIHRVKESLATEARSLLKVTTTASEGLQRLIENQPRKRNGDLCTSPILERLITGPLFRSEQTMIRRMAGIKPLSSKRKKKL